MYAASKAGSAFLTLAIAAPNVTGLSVGVDVSLSALVIRVSSGAYTSIAPEVQMTTRMAPRTIDSHRWVTMNVVVSGLRAALRLTFFLPPTGLGVAEASTDLSASRIFVAGLSDSRISDVGDSSAESVVVGAPLSICEG